MFGMVGLTFALPKGRILEQAIPLLARAGFPMQEAVASAGRKLLLELPEGHRLLLVKPTDVPTYVEHGIADIGIAGRDTLEEQGRDLYEPVDLGIGICRLVVAQAEDKPAPHLRTSRRRIATKYPNLASRHFHAKGIQAEIIHLYGSVELGALTDLADQIVDLVESGETLRQNRLQEVETIMPISSRLVVRPASLKLKTKQVTALIESLRASLEPSTAEAAGN